MFAQVCLIVGALLAEDRTLANGIRVVELPPLQDSFEIVAGYRSQDAPLTRAVTVFLHGSRAARTVSAIAYGAGGNVELISDLDRIAVRVTGPAWARVLVEAEVVRFLSETPENNPELSVRAAAAAAPPPDFRVQVENDLQAAVLGVRLDAQRASSDALDQFFRAHYGTDQAFVITTGPTSPALEDIPARRSAPSSRAAASPVAAIQGTRILQYDPGFQTGAVILAAPVPSVYYEGWYATLMLDQLIRTRIPGLSTLMVPSLETYYYRLEIEIPQGRFDDIVSGELIAQLETLGRTRPPADEVEAARAAAMDYLEDESTQRWFQAAGLEAQRREGIERVKSLTADSLRIAALDVVATHVIARWSPKPKQVVVDVESLDAPESASITLNRDVPLPDLGPIAIPAFPPHDHRYANEPPAETLESGVSVVASSAHALFLAPNDIQIFPSDPGANIVRAFEQYRADRILVMAPSGELSRIRNQWNAFRGSSLDSTPVAPMGPVANVDLPALLVLKLIVDRRLIESGLWDKASLSITATEGSELTIRGDENTSSQVQDWIRSIAQNGPSASEFSWGQEAAIHRLDSLKPHFQSLIWQRDREGVFQDLRTVRPGHVQDVAGIYFR